MSLTEAAHALSLWGPPQILKGGLRLLVQRGDMLSVFAEAKGGSDLIQMIVITTPGYGEPTDDEVFYRGINVFRLPIVEVVERIRDLGVEVVQRDMFDVRDTGDIYDVPDRFFGFWRDGGPEDDNDDAIYFECARIGDVD